MNFQDYLLEYEGRVACEPCLCITLFSEADLGVPDAPDMLGPYRAFLARFREQVSYSILDGNQARSKRIQVAHLAHLPNELADLKRRKQAGIMSILHAGQYQEESRAPSFVFEYSKIGRLHSIVRLNVPLAWFEREGLGGLQVLLREAVAGFAVQSGYVGYGVAWTSAYERIVEPYLHQWLQRHPGLMNPGMSHSLASRYGLPDLGWITLLGPALIAQIGGEDSLRERLAAQVPEAVLETYGPDVLGVRMGAAPRLGDVQAGDTMEDYQALGRLLSPLRDREAIAECMSVDGFDDRQYPGERQRWINRFFPE